MKFKKGDEVVLKENSPHFGQYESWGAKIGYIKNIVKGKYPYTIISGTYQQDYRGRDLELVRTIEEVESIKYVDEQIGSEKTIEKGDYIQEEGGEKGWYLGNNIIEFESYIGWSRDSSIPSSWISKGNDSYYNVLASKLRLIKPMTEEDRLKENRRLVRKQGEEIEGLNDSIYKLQKETSRLKAENRAKEIDVEVARSKNEEQEKIYKEELAKIKKLYKKHKVAIKKVGRNIAWDKVVIDEKLYNKLQLSYKKKMPMLLKGPSGTGKSTMVRALANEHGNEAVEFNFNGDTTVEHLLGHKILVNGNMIWEDGPLTDAVRNGKVFIGHELNSSNTEIQFIFNGLLELDSAGNLGKLAVQGNNGEVITPQESFRFYGTYNPGYLGTKTFGTSLMSRFIGAEVKPLGEKDEASFLQALYPNLIAEVNLLVDLESQLRKDGNFSYDISTRDVLQTLMFVEGGFSIKDAVEATIANSCQIDLEIDTLNNKLSNLISNVSK